MWRQAVVEFRELKQNVGSYSQSIFNDTMYTFDIIHTHIYIYIIHICLLYQNIPSGKLLWKITISFEGTLTKYLWTLFNSELVNYRRVSLYQLNPLYTNLSQWMYQLYSYIRKIFIDFDDAQHAQGLMKSPTVEKPPRS